jgi:hypothetical protein
MFFAVGTFPVGQNCVGTFPVAQQEISRQPFLMSGYFLLCNFVGIFPFGTMSGYFLLGVLGQVRSPIRTYAARRRKIGVYNFANTHDRKWINSVRKIANISPLLVVENLVENLKISFRD